MKKVLDKIVYFGMLLGAFGLGRTLYSPQISQFNVIKPAYSADFTKELSPKESSDQFSRDISTNVMNVENVDIYKQVVKAEEKLLQTIENAQEVLKEDADRRFDRMNSIYRMAELLSSKIEIMAQANMSSRPVPTENIAKYAIEMRKEILEEIERIRRINPEYVGGYP